jgi:UDP-N-acetylmuramoylalanine--D-glutamate ligase
MPTHKKNKTSNLKVIIGLGKTGFSCVKHLMKLNQQIAVIDSRTNPPYLNELRNTYPDVKIALESFEQDILCEATEIIMSPGVSLKKPVRGIPIIGDIELFAKATTAPVIAITGSNGKSTVTTLVGRMIEDAGLKVKVGGNLGQPALELIDEHEPDFYVLELSSFQLETTYSLKPIAATILNVTPDHLDRYENFHEYLKAKQRVYTSAKNIILNRDDPTSFPNLPENINQISFGLNEAPAHAFGFKDNFLMHGNNKLLESNELKIRGQHQVANALAALALGSAVNLPINSMLETLKNFQGLEHRCQWIRKLKNVDWYNDSKGTNVGATQAAVTGLGRAITGKIILIAGGIGKGADFSPLRSIVKNYVRELILIGRDAPLIAQALQDCCHITFAPSLQKAVEEANINAQSNDIVLLSPACASFDMFTNFEERGHVFQSLVLNLR